MNIAVKMRSGPSAEALDLAWRLARHVAGLGAGSVLGISRSADGSMDRLEAFAESASGEACPLPQELAELVAGRQGKELAMVLIPFTLFRAKADAQDCAGGNLGPMMVRMGLPQAEALSWAEAAELRAYSEEACARAKPRAI